MRIRRYLLVKGFFSIHIIARFKSGVDAALLSTNQLPHKLQTRLDAFNIDLPFGIDCSRFQTQSAIITCRFQLLYKASKIDLSFTRVQIVQSLPQTEMTVVVF